jgi:putative CocE/NonD family hydrolase
MGVDEWRSLADWPPPSAVPTAFHLRSGGGANTRAGDGTLSLDAPAADEPPDVFLYDPRHPVPSIGGAAYLPNAFANSGPRDQAAVEDRADVLVYTGEVLASPVTVLGPVTARVWLSSSAPATDVTAKLVDVHPDGRAVLLCDGIARVTLGSAGPGDPTPVDVDLAATGNAFLAGHRIRLEVSSSNFPRFARHPNTAGDPLAATDADLTPATQTIHHTATHPSTLTLPLLPD